VSAGRTEWEARYAERGGAERAPTPLLVEHVGALPVGRALDLACGSGRHALWLARRGWTVDAIDYARAGLETLAAAARREALAVHPVQANLEEFPLPMEHYDVVVNVRYLQRTLFAPIKCAVRPGGVVVFETFLRDQEQIGHPRNPAFLLERGELGERFRDFAVLTYEEGLFETDSGPAYLARLLARRRLD
jgi:SAM-dependent methyltransferase